MDRHILLLGLTTILLCLIISCQSDDKEDFRTPSNGTVVRTNHEDGNNGDRRRKYFEMKHRAAPGTDWRAIEEENIKASYNSRIEVRSSVQRSGPESFANGDLLGEWFERGSKNQAGSITRIDYDVDNDQIYVMSAGGSIFRGELSGNVWTPLNEDLTFRTQILNVVDNPSGGKRILAVIKKTIYYSDDDGLTWTEATGLNFPTGITTGLPISVSVLDDQTIYYLVYTWDDVTGGLSIWLSISTDRGVTFSHIYTFDHGAYTQTSMWSPFASNELYILDRSSTLYEVNGGTVSVLNTNTNLPSNVNCQLKGHSNGSALTLYALINNKDTYQSLDNGATWTFQGNFPLGNSVWDVGIEVSLDDPDILYAGAVNVYRSLNAGVTWEQVNFWTQYYANPLIYLHADIMDFASYYDQNGDEFTLIGNHGGISITYDNTFNYLNLGMQNLNVSQYYDVATSQADGNFMYAGSQDQGFQRGPLANTNNVIDLEQESSGDNGQIMFSNNGQALWQQYIGGNMSYYPNPQTGGLGAFWSMPGSDFPSGGWLYPCAETSDYTDNSIYMAGGNINGGEGSHLVTLTFSGGTINSSQFSYDFHVNSNNGNSEISAIEASLIDNNKIYVATDDGTFFYTNDNGSNWTKTSSFSGPGDWNLYGSSILASKLTSALVYFGGSGYSNPAVYKSEDGGQTFTAMSNGLPNTLVNELAASSDESLLFAATYVGPYVYSVSQDEWFDMRGLGAPMQNYTSVEFIPGQDVVRFGTYGRGVWDFEIDEGCIQVLTVNDIPIPSGLYQAGATVISAGQVQAGSNVIFQGEDCIELNPSFEVQADAIFVAEIENCNL